MSWLIGAQSSEGTVFPYSFNPTSNRSGGLIHLLDSNIEEQTRHDEQGVIMFRIKNGGCSSSVHWDLAGDLGTGGLLVQVQDEVPLSKAPNSCD